jgi:hypothetical protein
MVPELPADCAIIVEKLKEMQIKSVAKDAR